MGMSLRLRLVSASAYAAMSLTGQLRLQSYVYCIFARSSTGQTSVILLPRFTMFQ